MRTGTLLVATTAGMLTLGVASPASAATSGITTATITVQGGSLSITVPTDAGNLGTQIDMVTGGTISGLIEHSAQATITFPNTGALPPVNVRAATRAQRPYLAIASIVALLVGIAALLVMRTRRPRRPTNLSATP